MSGIPQEELPILEALINIRNRLTALKKNSSEFIRSHDVQQLYQQAIKQVTRLNAVRDELQDSAQSSSASGSASTSTTASEGSGQVASEGTGDDSPVTQTNRVDTTLNDVFALLSLFFLTIGRSRESPATFSQLSCMKQLLDHLSESGIYTEADLQPFAARVAEMREIIRKDADSGKQPPQLTKLMMRKLEGCEKVLKKLEGTLKVLSVELVPYHQKIVSIRRQLAAAAAKPKPARAEIKALQEELRKLDSKRVDGKFLGPGGSSVPAGQAILVGLLEECFEICHDITVRNDEVPMTLQPIYDRLNEIKSNLEHLVLTHRWTLRETDLWNYQVTLKEIDRMRVNGKFVDSEGKQPEGQLVLLYLLRRCYGLIYMLVASSEPISEELMPISNKLSTVSKCLKEVSKYGGPFTMRDLYPYRLALHQIGNMRSPVKDKDGNDTGVKKWLGRDGSVPEGQAILRAQFEEVEQRIEEMLNREDEDDDDDDDGEWDGSTASTVSQSDTDSEAGDSDGSAEPPSADMVRNALLSAGGPMLGGSSNVSDAALSSAAASATGPLEGPSTTDASASSGQTIRPHDGFGSGSLEATPVATTFAASQHPPRPLASSRAQSGASTGGSAAASPEPPTMVRQSSKAGKNFREGVGEVTGLSSRSPIVGATADAHANATGSSLSSTSALSSIGSAMQSPPSARPADAGSELGTSGNPLPPGMAPLAVPMPGRLDDDAAEGGPAVGTHVDALISGMGSTLIDDMANSN
ncbi:uncharacterized protein PFL1_03935 [Pseudozyma flocculosa PF-1]|uniref:Uncharacterized protein n=2 Tax=Pseudozyma flocculosa TaxID=84751 RepID=A0A5C3EWE3_9BASI|nr:uncharacterized protein PFL1_03935 [Pseudozyma flocculosa PF-1]EPQ28632.1 hypothetical protein PFL1_03935 [Pseudozyma flocculosa PF-1]SPO36574.1 uncharacterized protein PSFLO_02045 [Pseudozyma flocculosa]